MAVILQVKMFIFYVVLDKTLVIGWDSVEMGRHMIEITKNGRPVKGSPFTVDIEANNIQENECKSINTVSTSRLS